jgi:hypothetical protein
MADVIVVEATGMEFLSDRWGDSMGDLVDPQDLAALDRLADIVAACDEFAFVARNTSGEYGVRIESEFVWHASDDDEMVAWSWGDFTDEQILASVTDWVARVNAVASDFGVAPGVVVTGGDEMFAGRIGACWFVPETQAATATAFVSELRNLTGPEGAKFTTC